MSFLYAALCSAILGDLPLDKRIDLLRMKRPVPDLVSGRNRRQLERFATGRQRCLAVRLGIGQMRLSDG